MSGTLMDIQKPVERRLGPQEVAKALDVHRGSALAWMQSGSIPGAFQLGSRWFVRSERLREFMTAKGMPTDDLDTVLAKRK